MLELGGIMAEAIMKCHYEKCPYKDKEIDPRSGYVCMLTVGKFHRDCFHEWDKEQHYASSQVPDGEVLGDS